MRLQNLPEEINVELLLSYLPKDSYKVAFKGLHKRNAYHDILDVEEHADGSLLINLGRNSLYNALPEYLFHPIDRFSDLPQIDKHVHFIDELEKQEQEKENAYSFFAPIDRQLLMHRVMVREELRPITENDSILIKILGDRLSEVQHKNRFIKKALPFLPSCKNIRGNKTLLTLLLRKVFMDEGITIQLHERRTICHDDNPQYPYKLGNLLDDTFVSNDYDETILFFDVYFWPDSVDENFLQLINEIEDFRIFVQDYFMSVEEILQFDIRHEESALYLSEEDNKYLNYNTNL